eukprot:jgi/Psemu1/183545/e_gw1.32.163.1
MLRSGGKAFRSALTWSHRRRYRSSAAAAATALSGDQASSSSSSSSALPLAALSLAIGFTAGRLSFRTPEEEERLKQLPKGNPLACCGDHDHSTSDGDCDTPEIYTEHLELVRNLRRIVGKARCFDGRELTTQTSAYLQGARMGRGTALAIVRPNKLKQIQEIVQASVDAGCAVLVQGSNTGLTGASVPRPQTDGRPTVVISTKDLDTIFPIDGGEKVVCLAGVGLASLKHFVADNFPDRESHSILGSTFLNPTTAAGVAFGSGGTQSRKGPAFTDRALYLKVQPDKYGKHIVKVVNTLGIEDLDSEEGEFVAHKGLDGVIPKLDSYIDVIKNQTDNTMKKSNNTYGKDQCHDRNYKEKVCTLDQNVSRCNADTSGRDCNRSEGKVLILATVHDTFQAPATAKTYWVSFDSLETATKFKTEVCLDNPEDIPMSCEYMDKDSFEVIDKAGRFMGHLIKFFGSASPVVSAGWAIKLKIEALDVRGASTFPDMVQYYVNSLLPAVLPREIMELGRARDHHVATTVGDFNGSLGRFEERFAKFRREHEGKVDVHECKTRSEQNGVTAFRFIAAAAFKTYCVGTGLQGYSVDYALPKNDSRSPELTGSETPVKRMRYSHFLCNVVHEDLAYEQGVDTHAAKMELKHNRWKKMDPLNVMNPGVGGLSTRYRYEPEEA